MPIIYDRKAVYGGLHSPHVFPRALDAEQERGTDSILAEWERLQPAGDARFIAYMLATAWWETAHTMQPIEEIGHGRGRTYGEPVGPWHQAYYGRGLVQITWLAVYSKSDTRLHALGILKASESLVKTPSLALLPDIAAAIMFYGMIDGLFTGKRLADYFNGLTSDWVNARRIINGTDQAETIARAAEVIYAALKRAAISGVAKAPSAVVAERPEAATATKPVPVVRHVADVAMPLAPPAPTLWSRLTSLFGKP